MLLAELVHDIPVGWATIAASCVGGLGGIAAVIITPIVTNRRTGKKLDEIQATAHRVNEQVSNGHVDAAGNPINLRDDIDRITEAVTKLTDVTEKLEASHEEMRRDVHAVREVQRGHSSELGGLRKELRTVRDDINGLHDEGREQRRHDQEQWEHINLLEETLPAESVQRFRKHHGL